MKVWLHAQETLFQSTIWFSMRGKSEAARGAAAEAVEKEKLRDLSGRRQVRQTEVREARKTVIRKV